MTVKSRIAKLPVVHDLMRTRNRRLQERRFSPALYHPPGHYASPIPDLAQVRAHEGEIWPPPPRSLDTIDVRADEQLNLVADLAKFVDDQPFAEDAQPGLRYHFKNPWFGYADGIVLHCMLRWTQPRRLVEVGSGFSSAVTLDTNDRYLDGKIACTFIEPNADRLKSLLKPDDYTRHTIIEEPVQTVGLDVFAALEAGDVLFVDSSHVSKIGGDLNRIMFDVLPRLAPGVLVHFHDLYWPFEYPKKFVYSGRAWNENYLVRAFLMYNRDFEICLFNDYLSAFHHDEVSALLPPWGVERGGSLWLRRV